MTSKTTTGDTPPERHEDWLEIIWPETGLHTKTRGPIRERNGLADDDEIELSIDFLTLTLSPLEFIQLASFLRMSVDGLLDRHPAYQRAVVEAFDVRG
jgi:hypothetical protein